jgi:hypothetical protein
MKWFALLPADLRSRAVDLSPWGVAEYGFSLSAAEDVARTLVGLSFAVIGGDAWTSSDPPRPTYRNWHTEREPDETWEAFVIRARDRAVSSMRSIEGDQQSKPLYVLVAVDSKRDHELRRGIQA